MNVPVPHMIALPAAPVSVQPLPACVIPLRGGTGTPLFLVTGAGGGSHWFTSVVSHLAPVRPVYALEMMALSDQAIFGSIPEMAAEYLVALRQIQPHGPYLLGGFSMGGHVAYEMAQRLRGAGERIDLLALMDSYGPGADHRGSRRAVNYVVNFLRRSPEEKRAFVREKIVWLRFLWQRCIRNRDTPPQQNEFNRALYSQAAAAANYAARPWNGDIVLLRAATPPHNSLRVEEYCGWRSLLSGRISSYVMPCGHFTLFKPPHDGEIARLLDSHIAAAKAPVPPAGATS